MKCPGCGGELRYDIPSRAMVCDHCSGQYDPYEFDSVHSGVAAEDVEEGFSADSFRTRLPELRRGADQRG